MENQFSRTETLIGKEALAKLSSSRVAIFGIGGVGGHVVEALARSGVGTLDLIDNDAVSLTNLNRQIMFRRGIFVRYWDFRQPMSVRGLGRKVTEVSRFWSLHSPTASSFLPNVMSISTFRS